MIGFKGFVVHLVNIGVSRNNPFFLKRKQRISFRAAVDGIAALIEKECDKEPD